MMIGIWMVMTGTASAVQVAPVTDFDGRYDLWCESASLGIDLGLTVTVGTQSSSWSHVSSGPLPCGLPVRRVEAWARRLYADCVVTGLDATACRDFARGAFDVARPYSRIETDLLPTGVALTTVASPFSDLIGVYDTIGEHVWTDGSAEVWHYWLDNNVGSEGHLVSFGLAGDGVSDSQGFCLGTAIAAIDGWIDRDDGFSLSAAYGINTSLSCGGAFVGGGWVGTIGLTFAAGLGGQKLP